MEVARIPRWEAELWSCISSGDGVGCPLYDRCRIRQRGGWCVADNSDWLRQLLTGSQSSLDNHHDLVEKCSFMESVTPGRMFTLVEMLAQKYLKKGKVYYPPVPTELVSLVDEQYPVEVRLVPLVASHGAIWYLEDSWVIQLNKSDTPATRRFTLFHEAFHILAHRRATAVFGKRGVETRCFNELLAEQFAACILMPNKLVREGWLEINDVSKLAEIFAVPKPTACFRLKFLHLI